MTKLVREVELQPWISATAARSTRSCAYFWQMLHPTSKFFPLFLFFVKWVWGWGGFNCNGPWVVHRTTHVKAWISFTEFTSYFRTLVREKFTPQLLLHSSHSWNTLSFLTAWTNCNDGDKERSISPLGEKQRLKPVTYDPASNQVGAESSFRPVRYTHRWSHPLQPCCIPLIRTDVRASVCFAETVLSPVRFKGATVRLPFFHHSRLSAGRLANDIIRKRLKKPSRFNWMLSPSLQFFKLLERH